VVSPEEQQPNASGPARRCKPVAMSGLGGFQPDPRVPPPKWRGHRIAKSVEERLDVLRARVLQQGRGHGAFAMQLDLRRPVGTSRFKLWTIPVALVQPDEDATIAGDAQMSGGGKGLEIAGLACELHGDQRPGGGDAGLAHENEYRTILIR